MRRTPETSRRMPQCTFPGAQNASTCPAPMFMTRRIYTRQERRNTLLLFHEIRIDLFRRRDVDIAAVFISATTLGDTPPKQRFGVAAIEPDCFGVVRDGAIVVLLVEVNVATVDADNDIIWFELDHLIIAGKGVVIVALAVVQVGT